MCSSNYSGQLNIDSSGSHDGLVSGLRPTRHTNQSPFVPIYLALFMSRAVIKRQVSSPAFLCTEGYLKLNINVDLLFKTLFISSLPQPLDRAGASHCPEHSP